MDEQASRSWRRAYAAAHRAKADAIEIEALADRRLADEYDAAQEKDEAAVRKTSQRRTTLKLASSTSTPRALRSPAPCCATAANRTCGEAQPEDSASDYDYRTRRWLLFIARQRKVGRDLTCFSDHRMGADAMALTCRLFAGDAKLQAAATSNAAHIKRGAVGEHVRKIQRALLSIDNAEIAKPELANKEFGPTTEKAVLKYKQKRSIINTTYQRSADSIVGIMTMAALDRDMALVEQQQDEMAVLSALATAFGYTPEQKVAVTNAQPLRTTVDVLKSNIRK